MENCQAKYQYADSFISVEKYSEISESYEFLEMESNSSNASKKIDEVGFGRDFPWWHVTDKDELASWVSQRSIDFIENCDLPRPQNRSIKKGPRDFFGNCDYAAMSRKSQFSSPEVDIDDTSALGSGCRPASCEEKGLDGSDEQSSDNTIYKTLNEQIGKDPTKVQLMEALRHSQTRAREAEKAAKQANAEKEHVIKLFFKQATHLFAYKQWFKFLQLENIFSHIKNSNQPLSSLFPDDLPFNPNKNRKLPKNQQKTEKAEKPAREPEQHFGKFAVAFALGLGLVGTGLFLGWTVAWMLPAL